MGFKELINPFAFMLSEKSFAYEELAIPVTFVFLLIALILSLASFVFWAMPLEMFRAIVAALVMAYIPNLVTKLREMGRDSE